MFLSKQTRKLILNVIKIAKTKNKVMDLEDLFMGLCFLKPFYFNSLHRLNFKFQKLRFSDFNRSQYDVVLFSFIRLLSAVYSVLSLQRF